MTLGDILKRVNEPLAAISSIATAITVILIFVQLRDAQSVEQRQVLSEYVAHFDNGEMSEAKALLWRYHKLLCLGIGPNVAPAEQEERIADQTAQFFRPYVYGIPGDPNLAKFPALSAEITYSGPHDESAEHNARLFFRSVDNARRLIKNFYEHLQPLLGDGHGDQSQYLRRAVGRSHPGEFLKGIWLPVERGQNRAVGISKANDPDAEKLVAQYQAAFPSNSEYRTDCLAAP